MFLNVFFNVLYLK